MKKLILPDDKKQEETNVIPFEPKTKTEDNDPDWLWVLPEGTVILIQQPPMTDAYGRKHFNPVEIQYHVFHKFFDDVLKTRHVRLLNNLNGEDHFTWVESPLFCKEFTLRGIMNR